VEQRAPLHSCAGVRFIGAEQVGTAIAAEVRQVEFESGERDGQ
jgi:hypothetical protein